MSHNATFAFHVVVGSPTPWLHSGSVLFVFAQAGLDARVDCCNSPSHNRQPITECVLAALRHVGLAIASIICSATPQTMMHAGLEGVALCGPEFEYTSLYLSEYRRLILRQRSL